MLYLRLFYEFFKTGLFTIGGGMATVPFLYRMSDSTGWFTHNDLTNMIAVSESTPGPIGVNMATYVGYVTGMQKGGPAFAVLGAVTATLGLVTPSVIVILLIAKFIKNFRDNFYVDSAFYGLRPAATGLVAAAGLTVITSCLINTEKITSSPLTAINPVGLIMAVILWFLTNKVPFTKNMHPIVFILISAVAGIVLKLG